MATFYSNNTQRRKDEPEDLRQLRKEHGGSLTTLKELFADWSEEDLLYAIQDAGGDLEVAILRISDGHATQWGEVKGKKKTPKPKTTSEKQDFRSSSSQRGGFAGRGRGDSFRGGRGGATRGAPRALNGGDRNGRPVKTETDTNTTAEPSWSTETVEADKNDQIDATAAAAESWNATPSLDTTPATTTESTTNGEQDDTPAAPATTTTTTSTAADDSVGATPSAAAAVSATPAPRKVNTSTIPAGSKMSWAKIVKPNPAPAPVVPAPAPAPVAAPVHIPAPEVVAPKVEEPVAEEVTEVVAAVVEEEKAPEPATPEPEVVEPVVEKVEEKVEEKKVEEKVAATPEPEVVATPEPVQAASVSPKAAVPVGPPGLKAKAAPQPRRLNQDAPVVMPSGSSALQSVAVKFGSFSLSDESDSVEPETPAPSEPAQPAQAAHPEAVQAAATPAQTATPAQAQQQQPAYGRQPNVPSGAAGYQAAASPAAAASGLSPAATNASYMKQDPAANYVGQHHHHPGMGHDAMGSPYGSYMPGVNQLGSFGMGPMASLPNDYAALYGNDLQRAMYYDPASYGQIPVTGANNYQTRDGKYNQDASATASTTGASTTASTQAQQTLQQQQQQQQAYPGMGGMPYYPYYYMPNQFPNAYQQSGYGQPFVNKNMYPMYQHQQQQQQQQQPQHGSNKPGAAANSSPYGNYSSTGYSQGGYEDMSGAGIHGMGGLNNDPYAKYNPGMQNFLGNQQQPATPTTNASNTKGNTGANNYTGSDKNAAAGSQSSNTAGSGASSLQGQQPGGNVHQGGQQGGYYQQQQMFSNYQYPSHHQGYHPNQHQGSGRNQQQQFWSQN